MRQFTVGFIVASSLLVQIPSMYAQDSAPFSDVPRSSTAFEAITYLHAQGMLKGYADGTFRPAQEVDRAAAVKMILAGRVTDEQAAALPHPGFSDIPADAWYRGYAAKAVELHIIDGPSKVSTFNGSRPVVLAEFLKVLLLAQGMNPLSYSEIQSPLTTDVSDAQAWFYPFMRLSLATGLVQIDTRGQLRPDRKLTRGDVALLVYHLLMYKENRRTQALLSVAETELSGNLLNQLNPQGLPLARMSSTRALLAVRGALASRPDNPMVKGAVKITEGFGNLVSAYEAGLSGRPDEAIALAGQAYHLAEQAVKFSPELRTIATNMETIAHRMGEEGRAMKAKTQ